MLLCPKIWTTPSSNTTGSGLIYSLCSLPGPSFLDGCLVCRRGCRGQWRSECSDPLSLCQGERGCRSLPDAGERGVDQEGSVSVAGSGAALEVPRQLFASRRVKSVDPPERTEGLVYSTVAKPDKVQCWHQSNTIRYYTLADTTVTYSGRFDAKLALSVHQAVFDDRKETRVGVGGSDTDNGGPKVDIFKHRLLGAQETNTLWWYGYQKWKFVCEQ